MPKTIYALIVGISTYDDDNFSTLEGTLNDIDEMIKYLNLRRDFEKKYAVLRSDWESHQADKYEAKAPTRANLIHSLKTHFQGAGEEDIAVFYFAGHGVQEKTSVKVFLKNESDRLLESLVCQDTLLTSQEDGTGAPLADKELRYLMGRYIPKETGHTLVIMDCCHSGDNTRAGNLNRFISRTAYEDPLEERSLNSFLFVQEGMNAALFQDPKNTLQQLLPLKHHLQIAACANNELAWEFNREDGRSGGYFSITLFDILYAENTISYHELLARIRNRMRDTRYIPQTPRLFTAFSSPGEAYRSFLTGDPNEKPSYGYVSYNDIKGWHVNLGSMHGVPDSSSSKTPVFFVNASMSHVKVSIAKVLPAYSQVSFEQGKEPKKGDYQVYVKGLSMSPLRVFLDGSNEFLQEAEAFFSKKEIQGQESTKDGFLQRVDAENNADYVLYEGKAYSSIEICSALDRVRKPLVNQVEGIDKAAWIQVYNYLQHISHWTFVKNLSNPYTQLHKQLAQNLPIYPLQVDLYYVYEIEGEEKKEKRIPFTGKYALLPFNQSDRKGKFAEIRFELYNTSEKPLYVALIYLGMDFSVYTSVLQEEEVERLDPDSITHSRGVSRTGKYLRMRYEEYHKEYGWNSVSDFYTVMMSTHPFVARDLSLHELPAPRVPNQQIGPSREEPTENLRNQVSAPEEDWSALNFELEFILPKD